MLNRRVKAAALARASGPSVNRIAEDDDEGRPDRGAPPSWQRFTRRYPDVAAAYDALSEACRSAGPLSPQVVALLKLAVSVGAHSPRTVHAHAKKALRQGASPDELRHVALVALPTIGLPAMLDALGWIADSIGECLTRPGHPTDAQRLGAARRVSQSR